MNKIILGLAAGLLFCCCDSFAQEGDMFQGYVYQETSEWSQPVISSASVSQGMEADVIVQGKIGDVNIITKGECPDPTWADKPYEELTPESLKSRNYVMTNQKSIGGNQCLYTYYLTTTNNDRYHPTYRKTPR